MNQHEYEVIVGNVGTVYKGSDATEAHRLYNHYVELSRTGAGRVAYEDVTLFLDGEPSEEYRAVEFTVP